MCTDLEIFPDIPPWDPWTTRCVFLLVQVVSEPSGLFQDGLLSRLMCHICISSPITTVSGQLPDSFGFAFSKFPLVPKSTD